MTGSKRYAIVWLLLVAGWRFGASAPALAKQDNWHQVHLREINHDVSPPLWRLARDGAGTPGADATPASNEPDGSKANEPRSLVPLGANPPVSTTNLLNFDGIAADNGQIPPDTNGAVGGSQFVQWVNVEYAVYDKTTGHRLLGPQNGNTIWNGFGGPCASNNSGEPVVEFDKMAQRWVLAQPVLVSPYYYCVAVSTSSDATGTYNRYAFALQLPAGQVPDNPKLAVWPDAYYASFNIYSGSASGPFLYPLVIAYDRTNMLAGMTARNPIVFSGTPADFNPLPSDMDGNVPPAGGEPNTYWELGTDDMSLIAYAFHVDFVNPSNSTYSLLAPVPINTYKPCTENPPQWKGVAQKGTTTKLNLLADRLMPRAAWHNVGGVEYVVLNHTVMLSQLPSGTVAGIAWYQIQNPASSSPIVVDQGVLAAGAGTSSFWMGSIAMDKTGDLTLGFSNSSPSIYPGIEYDGRVPTDPLGTMEAPHVVVRGGGAQLNNSLWGAYSSMSIDPSDDCTFWYTTEYQKTTGAANWSTRIASFKFNSCM